MCFSLFVAMCAAVAAASAPTAETLIADIDRRCELIVAQGGLGAELDEVAGEQAKALLQTFSQIPRISLEDVTRVSKHLKGKGEWWTRSQLTAFSVCLRANATTRLDQPAGPRPMQANPCLEFYLLQAD